MAVAVDVSLVASLSTAAAVIVAVVIGVAQMRQHERKRRDAAAMDLLSAFREENLAIALDRLLLSGDAGPEAFAEESSPYVRAALRVGFAGDGLGVMVFYRIIPLHLLDDVMGRFIRLSWRKVKPYAEFKRKQLGHNNYFEWFEWLADQLDAHPVLGKKEGAHVFHKGWQP